MRFVNDPVHKVRGIRKKRKIKQIINEKKSKYKDDLMSQYEKQVAKN